ncbi:tyrosine-type recombinase/integrase [Shewanella fodinae]|uniref:Phage integrase family protein n=1 Tax=Shewanella fodinae TaxID=552357 RepID=A0A4R2FK79_9GAMM|nr:site-specific integrase [Shewanella fodinae]TCN87870.1 phage integrase family protein [Shewanella fodinae]
MAGAPLTEREIKGAKPKANKYELTDSTRERGAGRLVVRVSTTGAKEFAFKYQFEGKRQYIALGRYPSFSLTQARDKAQPLAGMIKDGIDPKVELAKEKAAKEAKQQREAKKGSIEQLFNSYTEQMAADGKRTYKAVLAALEKEVYPLIPPATKAKDIQPDDIKLVLGGMIRRGAATQSNRVRSYLMAAFNYGLRHDNDPAHIGSAVLFGIKFNPVAPIPKQTAAERVGENYLTFDEVKTLMADMENRDGFRMGFHVAKLIQLCIYAGGQRPYELTASRWDAVNWTEKTLEIVADVSKNKRAHLLPLTDTALAILEQLHQQRDPLNPYIFPHRFNTAEHLRMDSLTQGIGRYRAAKPAFKVFVARDLRRTCKTLMGALGISKDIRDRLQNHALNDVSSKHYDRYSYLPEKRRALEAWEAKLNEIDQGNVVHFKAQSISS